MVLFLCKCRIGAKKSNHFVSSLLFLQIDKKNTFFLDLEVESFVKICVSFLLFLQIDLATSYVKRLLSQDKLTNLASLCTFPQSVIFFLQNLSSLNTFYTKLPLLVWSEEMLGLKDEHRASVQKTLTRWTISDGVCCWDKFCHTSSVEVELLPQEHLSKYVRGAVLSRFENFWLLEILPTERGLKFICKMCKSWWKCKIMLLGQLLQSSSTKVFQTTRTPFQ